MPVVGGIVGRFTGLVEYLKLSEISKKIKKERLTYLSSGKIRCLEKCLKEVEDDNIPGNFLEFGVAMGGSAILIASMLGRDRTFHGYDVFGMIPPPGSEDDSKSWKRYEVIASGKSEGISGDRYYGYKEDLYDEVIGNFDRYNVPVDEKRIFLHKGLFEDTIDFDNSFTIAFAHIDCDWYDPVTLCLNKISDRLSTNGLIVLDDYNDYGGCKKAVDNFLSERKDIELIQEKPNAILVKR